MDDFITPYRRYAEFTGRSDRKEFWLYTLFYLIVSAILSVIDGMIFGHGVSQVGNAYAVTTSSPLASIFGLASLIPSIAVSVRRLHDSGKSGWWYLMWLVPLVGWVVLLIFYCQKGEPQTNQHGPAPDGSHIGL